MKKLDKQLVFEFNDVVTTKELNSEITSTHPIVPGFLNSLDKNNLSLSSLLNCIGVTTIFFHGAYWVANNSLTYVGGNCICGNNGNKLVLEECKLNSNNEYVYEKALVYLDDFGNIWTSVLKLYFNQRLTAYNYNQSARIYECLKYSVDNWTIFKSKFAPGLHFIQSDKELNKIMMNVNPYCVECAEKNHFDIRCLILAPYLEILLKAGYEFVKHFSNYEKMRESECILLNRLCKNATKPKDIFKTCKMVYSVLRKETNLEIWDSFRKLVKLGKIGVDTIQQAYDLGFNAKDLEYCNSILAKKNEGKPIFTWNSLMQYLVRLDTFEAIAKKEAFILINDYLSMCNLLGMKPRIDGDSLKREHDIAARNCRNKRDEIIALKMRDSCEKMKIFNYDEGIYFVRAIRDYDDLLDEANQQHNCVASYGQNIAQGLSYIYVMREVAHPEKSLVTIELSPKEKNIRQKYLAYNQPIRNKSQSEFIERWIKHIRSIA